MVSIYGRTDKKAELFQSIRTPILDFLSDGLFLILVHKFSKGIKHDGVELVMTAEPLNWAPESRFHKL